MTVQEYENLVSALPPSAKAIKAIVRGKVGQILPRRRAAFPAHWRLQELWGPARHVAVGWLWTIGFHLAESE